MEENTKKKRFNFKINFSNAILVLILVAMLSIVVYAIIVNAIGETNVPTNSSSGSNTNSTQVPITSGTGYSAYQINGKTILEITDGTLITNPDALRQSLNLPDNTEIINPGAAHARPVDVNDPENQLPDQHIDDNFGNP